MCNLRQLLFVIVIEFDAREGNFNKKYRDALKPALNNITFSYVLRMGGAPSSHRDLSSGFRFFAWLPGPPALIWLSDQRCYTGKPLETNTDIWVLFIGGGLLVER